MIYDQDQMIDNIVHNNISKIQHIIQNLSTRQHVTYEIINNELINNGVTHHDINNIYNIYNRIR